MDRGDLDAVADELYALWPAEFTAARTAREKEARSAGDKELAAQIKTLGKPTTVAWLANRLVRDHDDELRPLLELGDALREATAVLRGEDLRRLSQQQHQLVAALVRQARRDAADAGHRVGEDAARGLEETLRAALADAGLAEELAAGRLTGGLTHSGFAPGGGGGPSTARATPGKSPAAAGPTSASAKAGGGADRAAREAAEKERRAVERDRAERDLAGARLQAAEAAEQHAAATAEAEDAAAAAAELAERAAALKAELKEVAAEQKEAERRHRAAGPALAQAERAVRVADRLVDDREARVAELLKKSP